MRGSLLARLARPVLSAPVVGALYVFALYAAQNVDPLVPPDEVLLGRSAARISEFMAVRFAGEIRRIGLTLSALALAIGFALGMLALAIHVLRDAAHERRTPRTGLRAAASGLALVALLHAGATLASMARWPALYSRVFYAKGGLGATLQVFVVTRLGAGGVVALVAAVVLLVVLGLPTRWPSVARRLGPRAFAGTFVVVLGLVGVRAIDRDGALALALAPPPPRRADAKKRPNVLVLAADGLRADRLRPDVAPRLSAVADRGTRFDRAYVSVARTLCSWTTILTGLYAHHHGVRTAFPSLAELHAQRDALPARLRASGWATGVASDYAGDVFEKVDYGFAMDRAPRSDVPALLWQRAFTRATALLPFLHTRAGRTLIPALADWPDAADPKFVAEDAVDILREAEGRPFFVVVFFSTTHSPYAVPAPYFTRFTDPRYAGVYRFEKQVAVGLPPTPDAADVAQIRGLYDGAVAAVDAAAGTVLDELAREGLADDTIVVVTSDHGEMLFENGRWQGHGDHLFGDEGLHVPLAVFDPRAPVARHEGALVSNVDLAPTLYDLTGVAPPPDLDGRSLAAAVHGDTALASRPVYAETELWFGAHPGLPDSVRIPPPPLFDLFDVADTPKGAILVVKPSAAAENLVARHRMIRDDRYKLIYMPTKNGVEWRLYDLASDPDERTDVKAEVPEVFERMRRELFVWILEDPKLERDGGDMLRIR